MIVFKKAFALLGRRKRWQLLAVFVSTVVMGLVATLGVASIMPFMAVVANPDVVTENRWMAWAYERFGFQTPDGFLFALGLLTLGIIAGSNVINAFNTWLIARFTAGLNHDISQRLFGKYLSQSYAFYLGRNTSRLAKNVLAEVAAVVNGVVKPLVDLVAKAIIATFILALLLYVDVVLALIVAIVLGGLYGGVYVVVRKQQGVLGRRKVEANSGRYRAANEAFGGIKDVKILGRERQFLRRFSRPSYRYARTNASNAIISQIPRHALETVAFGGILLIVLYLLRTYEDLGQVLPIVSLYAFAAYRLMPAFQQIFGSLTKTRFNLAALDDLYSDLVDGRLDRQREMEVHGQETETISRKDLSFDREIRLENVSFRYSGAASQAIDDVSFAIPRNTTTGLVGHTGSGKTTLADLLLGLFEPTGGKILVDGEPLEGARLFAWRERIGYVPQQIYLADDTIRRNIAFGIPQKEIDEGRVLRAARIAHLEEFVSDLPAKYDTLVGDKGVRLSGGQRQRVGIARALYGDPDVLVMDEATSALDNITENAVMDAIRELSGKKTVVLIAHRLTTVEDCDQIVMLNGGRLEATGSFRELIEHSPAFRTMAGVTNASIALG